MSEEIKRPKDLVYKSTPIELKEDGDTRYLEAVFSLFDKVDSDNDITQAGALKSGYEGNKVPLVWNHDWSKVIGRGVIESDNEKAVFKGYFLNTESGKEAYETVKQMRDMQQFSYGFQVLDSDRAEELGCSGFHEHMMDGETVYMPCSNMDDYTRITGQEHESEDNPSLTYAGKISSETDTEISTSTQQGKRLEEQALSSLEEIKAFTERIEDLALLRNSEKKTMSSKSTELLSKYLQGLNAIYNRLDDVLETHGYDEVSDDELFLEVQKNIFKNQ
jgi:HK97 family phage prohead protease